MMYTAYLLYLVLAAFFMLFYGKVPKIYQLFLLAIFTAVLTSHGNIDTIAVAISKFKNQEIGLPDLLLTFVYAYFNAWETWDNKLLESINMYEVDKMKSLAGTVLFFGMDLLYLVTATFVILGIINLFKGGLFYMLKINMDKEHEKELDLAMTLASLVVAFCLGYLLTGFDGLFATFKLLLGKVSNFLGVNETLSI